MTSVSKEKTDNVARMMKTFQGFIFPENFCLGFSLFQFP